MIHGEDQGKRSLIQVALFVMVMLGALAACPLAAQQAEESPFKAMKWRLIGPFRGGRSLAVTGVSGDPNVYYFGGVAGGVWKTTDAGSTWQPLFDSQPVS